MKNYYEILGLENFAGIAEVKKAFKQLALLYHPDRNPNNKEAEEQFKLINEAHRVLSNEDSKGGYDWLLTQGHNQQTIQEEALRRHQEVVRREQERRAMYEEILRRKAEKPAFHISNVQATLFAVIFVAYALLFANTITEVYARVQYLVAKDLVAEKKYKEAFEHLQKATSADHDFLKSYELMAKVCLENLGYYNYAIEHYSHLIDKTDQQNPQLFYWRGLAQCHQRHEKLAKKDFDYVVSVYPDSLALKEKIADHYYYLLKSIPLSVEIYQKILAQAPTNYDANFNLGNLALHQEQYDAATIYFTTLINNGKTTATVYKQRSLCYLGLQNMSAACADWKLAKQQTPEITHEVLDFFCQNNATVQ
jgi:tetratricopeptide (TPR) repeat protein